MEPWPKYQRRSRCVWAVFLICWIQKGGLVKRAASMSWYVNRLYLTAKMFSFNGNLQGTTIENASKTGNAEWKHVYKKASEQWDELQMVFERDFRFSYHLIGDPSRWRGQRLHVTSPPSYGTGTFPLFSSLFLLYTSSYLSLILLFCAPL